MLDADRRLPWDWYHGKIPENVVLDETAYVETSFSFLNCRSEAEVGIRLGHGASTYLGTMFDVGPRGQVRIGDYALVHGARIVCDLEIEIGDYSLLSWNVVLMDSYRVSLDPDQRRHELKEAARRAQRLPVIIDGNPPPARAICIGKNVWIGFDACVLPGVTIGDGAIVGARSVVIEDVEPYTIVAGNPARPIRRLASTLDNERLIS
jgi:acetyltransferase-like isoleucine patch superfamily enzyme